MRLAEFDALCTRDPTWRIQDVARDGSGDCWLVHGRFWDDRLTGVELYLTTWPLPEGDWLAFPLEEELAKRGRHDGWLADQLGRGWERARVVEDGRGRRRVFHWGVVYSGYSPRDLMASIHIEWWNPVLPRTRLALRRWLAVLAGRGSGVARP